MSAITDSLYISEVCAVIWFCFLAVLSNWKRWILWPHYPWTRSLDFLCIWWIKVIVNAIRATKQPPSAKKTYGTQMISLLEHTKTVNADACVVREESLDILFKTKDMGLFYLTLQLTLFKYYNNCTRKLFPSITIPQETITYLKKWTTSEKSELIVMIN